MVPSENDFQRISLNAALWLVQILASSTNLLFGSSPGGIAQAYSLTGPLGTVLEPPPSWFAVWAVLYPFTFAYVVWQALPVGSTTLLARSTGWPALAVWSALALWGAIASSAPHPDSLSLQLFLSTLLLSSLVPLFLILARLAAYEPPFSRLELFCVAVPFSALCSWLFVALALNLSSTLVLSGANWLSYSDATSGAAAAASVALLALASFAVSVALDANPWFTSIQVYALCGVAVTSSRKRREGALVAAICGVAAVAALTFVSLLVFKATRMKWLGPLLGLGDEDWREEEADKAEERQAEDEGETTPLRLSRSLLRRSYGMLGSPPKDEMATT
jgi:hypothetical protein